MSTSPVGVEAARERSAAGAVVGGALGYKEEIGTARVRHRGRRQPRVDGVDVRRPVGRTEGACAEVVDGKAKGVGGEGRDRLAVHVDGGQRGEKGTGALLQTSAAPRGVPHGRHGSRHGAARLGAALRRLSEPASAPRAVALIGTAAARRTAANRARVAAVVASASSPVAAASRREQAREQERRVAKGGRGDAAPAQLPHGTQVGPAAHWLRPG